MLWIGAQQVLAGQITPGRLGQFILYAVLAGSALGSLSEIGGEVAQASGAAERLFEILAIRPAIAAPAHPLALPSPTRGEVAFEDVHFSYPTRPNVSALDGVSFVVRPGEKVAIVGPSGAGKSTIFHLLLRYYDPTAGVVSFDGVALPRLDPADLRARIALVPQDSVMFATTIGENIRFGRPDASDAEVARAAELAYAASFIAALPQGWKRRSANAASRCPAGNASASPSRARSCATRRFCCSTKRRRRSMPKARPRSRRRSRN